MAHKGVLWPVGFRRDLNLNVTNNNDGFANRYLVTLNILPPGPGHALVGSMWDCGPEQVTPADTIFWVADPQIFGLSSFDVILSATIIGGTTYEKRIRIREAFSGTVLILQCNNDPAPSGPNFPFFANWTAIFFDGFYFTSGGFANQINAAKKRWADGPPH